MSMCLVFVFIALLEYAVVNVLSRKKGVRILLSIPRPPFGLPTVHQPTPPPLPPKDAESQLDQVGWLQTSSHCDLWIYFWTHKFIEPFPRILYIAISSSSDSFIIVYCYENVMCKDNTLLQHWDIVGRFPVVKLLHLSRLWASSLTKPSLLMSTFTSHSMSFYLYHFVTSFYLFPYPLTPPPIIPCMPIPSIKLYGNW